MLAAASSRYLHDLIVLIPPIPHLSRLDHPFSSLLVLTMRLNPLLLLAAATFFSGAVIANQAKTAASTSASSASSFPTSPTPSFSTSSLIALTATPTILDGEEPQITEAPEILNGDMEQQLQEKYHMTTYWSCVTIATQVHCGWHEPVLPGGDEIAGANGRGVRVGVAAMFAAAVAIFLR